MCLGLCDIWKQLMKTYKYYTPENLAEFLVLLLPQKHYRSVIDICCGSWNLLNAALRTYSELTCVGVDIDRNAERHKPDNASFHCCEGREFAIKTTEKYDLILSNPPFGLLSDDQRLFYLMEQSSLLSSLCTKRYESEMTQANLLLARPGSVLLFIWPSTFIEGDTYRKMRKEIAQDYTVNWIAKLPDNTFGKPCIATYAVAMTKEREHKCATVCWEIYKNGEEWCQRNQRQLKQQDVCNGNWSEFLSSAADNSISVIRGNICGKELKKNGSNEDVAVLHCTGICKDGNWQPIIRYAKSNILQETERIVKKDDILICRIGRSAGYWCKNPYDNVLISDCILMIPFEKRIFDRFEKFSKGGRLQIPIRGVTTKYVTARDIRRILHE